MTKIIFGIFAHPDDEAFGPSGALIKAVHEGAELHLITLTSGDAGMNPDEVADLGTVRLQEWQAAGKLLRAKSMHHLGYKDGHLDNLAMIEIGDKILELVRNTLNTTPAETEVDFITLDLNGLTGHIDHIVAARATSFAFYKLKKADSRLKKIWFSCLTEANYPTLDTGWIFREKGRSPSEITDTIDAREFKAEITAIASCHQTQRQDLEHFLKTAGDNLGINYFIVRS
jgi:LmbE family N-acetylglucosaminyl deacetylase